MPLKKLQISFELDAELLCKMLIHSNSMNIEAFHQEIQREKLKEKLKHPALPPPSPRAVSPAGMVILKALADGKLGRSAIKAALEAGGFSQRTVNSGMFNLLNQNKLVKRVGYGVYQLTTKGRNVLSSGS
jgi:hypothetical protein